MILDITSLQQAIKSLKEALDEHKINPSSFVRDSCIQRFEYTYELSHKMLKRHLEHISSTPIDIDYMSIQELIRTGAEKGLLKHSWDKWRLYRAARNATSHAYNEHKAQEVFTIIPEFYAEADYLQSQLLKAYSHS